MARKLLPPVYMPPALDIDGADPCRYSDIRSAWVQPLPMPADQSVVRVSFELTNTTDAEISGRVRASIGPTQFMAGRQHWQELIVTPSCDIQNLKPGASASGDLWMYGMAAGDYTLELRFEVPNPNARPVIVVTPAGTVEVTAIGGVEIAATAEVGYVVLPLQTILTTDFENPSGMFGACGGQTYESRNMDGVEWAPISKDYAAVTGTAISPSLSGDDIPFTHPFGFDFEFYVAPDPNSNDNALLAPSNITPTDGEYKNAFDVAVALLRDPNSDLPESDTSFVPGILGVETDAGLIPDITTDPERRLRPAHGDRVVVHGEWIEDCGHSDFHAEIHRPVLVIRAHTPHDAHGSLMYDETRSSIIARPYAPLQTFGGISLFRRLIDSVARTVFLAGPAEANCDFAKNPFEGTVDLTYTVTPASPRLSDADRLEYDYFLTVRDGVDVTFEVLDSAQADGIVVHVVMDGKNCRPAPLKEPYVRRDVVSWTLAMLSALGSDAASIYKTVDTIEAAVSPLGSLDLMTGIRMNAYTIEDAPPLPVAGNGQPLARIIVNDQQPYPVCGWVTARWVRESIPVRLRNRQVLAAAASPLMNPWLSRYLTADQLIRLTGPIREA